jgi:hypothetical protein
MTSVARPGRAREYRRQRQLHQGSCRIPSTMHRLTELSSARLPDLVVSCLNKDFGHMAAKERTFYLAREPTDGSRKPVLLE